MGRWGDRERGRKGEREMGRKGDGEKGRWGEREVGRWRNKKLIEKNLKTRFMIKRSIALVLAFVPGLISFSQKIDNLALDSAISRTDRIISTDNRGENHQGSDSRRCRWTKDVHFP